jgi:excisionase family DNA binding protein
MTGIPFRERISCTVAEACDATGIGRTKLYELIRLKQVTAKKIGRRTVILIPTCRFPLRFDPGFPLRSDPA